MNESTKKNGRKVAKSVTFAKQQWLKQHIIGSLMSLCVQEAFFQSPFLTSGRDSDFSFGLYF